MTQLSLKAAALGLGLFALGLAAGLSGPAVWRSFGPTATGEDEVGAMRDAMARTAALTTSQTLVAMPRDAVGLKADIAAALQRVGLAVAPEALNVPGRTLMRANLYHFGDGPVAQFVWMDEESGAISLFVERKEGAGAAPAAERRGDMNIVVWASRDHAFTLAGLAPEEILTAFSLDLLRRLAQKE